MYLQRFIGRRGSFKNIIVPTRCAKTEADISSVPEPDKYTVPERFTRVVMTRRYTNPRLPYLTLLYPGLDSVPRRNVNVTCGGVGGYKATKV